MRGSSDRRAALVAADTLVAMAAVFLAVDARFGAGASDVWRQQLGLPPILFFSIAFAALTFASFAIAGVYRPELYWDFKSELVDLSKGLLLLGALSLSLLFLFKLEDVSRIAITITFLFLGGGAVVSRAIIRDLTRRASISGASRRNWLIVGSGARVAHLVDLVHAHPQVGAKIVGLVGDISDSSIEADWLGPEEELPEILRREVVDEVIVLTEGYDPQKLEAILSVCTLQGKTVRLPMDMIAPTVLRGRIEEQDGIPMWSILTTSGHEVALASKRIFDVIGSSVLLVLSSPAWLIAAVGTLITEGRPIFYSQMRGGHNGRPFRMLKFRTMVNGAEHLRDGLLDRNERTGPVFKVSDDPRVTPFGKWLRRTSIDELPQLINVIGGQMSLVGPRPQPIEEVESYDLWHRRRLSMRPGITGLWQVRARHDPSFDSWMDLDLEYIDRWSLSLDAQILARTPRALVRSPGE